MEKVPYLERQGRPVMDAIESIAYDDNGEQVTAILWKAYWELTRLSELLYEQEIELGSRQFEIDKLTAQLKACLKNTNNQ